LSSRHIVFVRFRRCGGSRSDRRQHRPPDAGSESGRLEDRLPNQRRQSSNHRHHDRHRWQRGREIIYKLDDAGHYESGQVFAANGALRFKTLYAYDTTGRLTQETQLAKDDSVRNRIVYSYDTAGHQTGYCNL
jgi:hypothetical protein